MTTSVRMSLSPDLSPPAPAPPARRWPRVIWALLVGTFIARAAGFACALNAAAAMFTWLPMLMAVDGLDASAYGWTQVATAAVVVLVTPVLMPFLGRRADGPTPMVGHFAISSLILGVGMGAAGLADTTLQYSLAAGAAVTGEVILFVAAGDLIGKISPPEARGFYAGAWGTQLALPVITAPILASWAIETGGDLLAAAVIFTAGLLGAALCLPLRALLDPAAAVPDASPRS
ncbi:hypothetical protein OHA61_22215 [Streptomyces sp. NBC_00885]|uniref:hypothetical protein n=1 Tax=Streptomyces sp. NBC_00885 TaxID=2975857 RepID=UPI00386B9188|nr:hypothetical protein OHA61_22215 [Streptomyces sp. NBC_00885]